MPELSTEQINANVVTSLTRRQRHLEFFYQKRNTSKKGRAKRKKLWAETQGVCVYCNQHTPEKERTMDHIWPESRGGNKNLMNLIPACMKCNTDRGSKFPASPLAHERWRKYVRDKEICIGIVYTSASTLTFD